ncbi:hypothetical protein F5884DRAFT_861470 [Xylogone sp. PMI_703]|nr:hypothetical protein F5884DRAFT_861470 [Xylogone sp. PMI_703]
MEFDLEAFMSEVTEALQPSLAPSRSNTPERLSSCESEIDTGVESPEESGPPPKRRRVSPSDQSTDGLESFTADTNDGIPSFFRPSLDMTTALVSLHPRLPPSIPSTPEDDQDQDVTASLMTAERVDLVPNFYAYSVKAVLLPIRRVQNELVMLYFQNIHPMFPVVDEHRFASLHKKYRGQEELMNPSDFTLYHAIMVAGFAHLSEAQVHSTPYRSVLEGQKAQVEQLKARYWSQLTVDPIVLTQICLILSLWSPGWIGPQNNSYWLDMAFKHATSGQLWKSPSETERRGPYCRRRILWWCCVVRDRVLALGMRRPQRLHKIPEGEEEDNIITESDFGPEAKFPAFTDLPSKKSAMLTFIWFCKLSKIMANIAVAQRKHRFSRDWSGDEVGNTESELVEVNKLDAELQCWLQDFENAAAEVTKLIKIVPVPISTMRIMAHSLRAIMYQSYLHLPVDHPSLVSTKIDPLKIVKDGAQGVASSVRDVMMSKKGDAIPTWLASWVTVPFAVYHVDHSMRDNPSSDNLFQPFFSQLVRRSSGAQMLLMTVRSATKVHIEKTIKEEEQASDHFSASNRKSNGATFNFVHSNLSQKAIPRSTEANTLAFVTKAIDYALERNGSNSPEET